MSTSFILISPAMTIPLSRTRSRTSAKVEDSTECDNACCCSIMFPYRSLPSGPRSRLRSSFFQAELLPEPFDFLGLLHEGESQSFGLLIGQRAGVHAADGLAFQ